jgi:cysteinyl-tRNA synthetase
VTLKLYNTLSRRVEEFVPGGKKLDNPGDYPPVTIYSCGPTVYGYAHIGNFRTFVFNDLLRRYLLFRGFRVDHAMNITDVDDKTIAGAAEEKVPLKEYTDRYISIFFEDLQSLNIEQVEHYPRATETIDSMVEIMKRLDEKGLIYTRDGSVYFSIEKYRPYGRLSGVDRREFKTGTRYDTDEYEKDDIRDFALWKSTEPGEVSWETPFGPGRPGWHIECSAMIEKIFHDTIDIHTGGVDLIFPHHENEIAQSEAAFDRTFVRNWIHVEHLLVDGAKMSKSRGNFYTLRDLLDMGHSPRAIRYLLLSAHYRKQLNFTLEGLEQARQALERIDNLLIRLGEISDDTAGDDSESRLLLDDFFKRFAETVDDDLNIAGGMGVFFEFLHEINSRISLNRISAAGRDALLEGLKKIDRVFGFIFWEKKTDVDPVWIEKMIEERRKARSEKNFSWADAIRDELLDKGIILEDTKDGTRWKIRE